MEVDPWSLSQSVCGFIVRLLIFVSWFYILPLCWNCWSLLENFWKNFWDLLYTIFQLQMWIVLTFFPNFIAVISFSCFIFQVSASSPVWKGSGDSGNSYLLPDFNEITSCVFFLHLWWCSLYVSILYWGTFPLLSRIFIIKAFGILSDAFYDYIDVVMWFVFSSLFMQFIMFILIVYVEPFLHFSDKANMVMADILFDICLYFIS